MNRPRCLVLPALLLLCGCESLSVGVGDAPDYPRRDPTPQPAPRVEPVSQPPEPTNAYAHLPQRTSFCPRSSVQLKEGCYEGDFELGSSQIQVTGAGIDKTVIHGNLIVKTQCVVSSLTVTGDVIFEGHQAKLVDADYFGRVIDKGMQNTY